MPLASLSCLSYGRNLWHAAFEPSAFELLLFRERKSLRESLRESTCGGENKAKVGSDLTQVLTRVAMLRRAKVGSDLTQGKGL